MHRLHSHDAFHTAAGAAVVFQVDWESMWREQLSEYSRSAAGIGWTTKITMEVRGLLRLDTAAATHTLPCSCGVISQTVFFVAELVSILVCAQCSAIELIWWLCTDSSSGHSALAMVSPAHMHCCRAPAVCYPQAGSPVSSAALALVCCMCVRMCRRMLLT